MKRSTRTSICIELSIVTGIKVIYKKIAFVKQHADWLDFFKYIVCLFCSCYTCIVFVFVMFVFLIHM